MSKEGTPSFPPLTDREIAIAEGRNPDAIETAGGEAVPNNDQASEYDTPADDGFSEEDSVREDATGPASSDDHGDGGQESDWVTDDIRSLAASYGLRDNDLERFSGPAEFQRAAMMIDRNFAGQVQRTTPSQNQQQPPTPQQPVAGVTAPAAGGDGEEGKKTPKKYEFNGEEKYLTPDYFEQNGFDSDMQFLVDQVRQQQETIEQLSGGLGQFFEQQQAQAQAQEDAMFHQMFDEMEEGRYGRAVKDGEYQDLGEDQLSNRQAVREAFDQVVHHMHLRAQQTGSPMPDVPDRVLLQRAELLAFGDQIRQDDSRRRSDAVARQSARRRQAGAQRPQQLPRPERPRSMNERVQALVNDPDLKKHWDELQDA